jgi:hypothetical protein
MTETQKANEVESAVTTGTPPAQGQVQGQTIYNYESAGIAEREGNVPIWLWIVVFTLLIWGVYYLVTYWNAPIIPA